jgi:plasmid stabilization system protein ParE
LTAKIHFHPAAEEELAAALDWYQERSARAAYRFLQEVAATLERIRHSTGQFASSAAGIRRARLVRFPYSLVFREGADGIEVFAIAHAKRKPGYWRSRVGDRWPR